MAAETEQRTHKMSQNVSKIRQLKRLEFIEKNILFLSQEEMAKELKVTRMTIERDIDKWKQSGGYQHFLSTCAHARRGRPRTRTYENIAEYLLESQRIYSDWLKRRAIIATLMSAAVKTLEKREGQIGYHGDRFECSRCGQLDVGRDFLYDPNHKPPRLRVTLKCGHRMDFRLPTIPKQCPKCGGEIQEEPGTVFCIMCDWKMSTVPSLDFGEPLGKEVPE